MISFNPLWKTLIDKDMTKTELRLLIGAGSATITRMGKNGTVTTEILDRICKALDCEIGDVIEYRKDPS